MGGMSNDGHDTSDDISWFGIPMMSPVTLTAPYQPRNDAQFILIYTLNKAS